MLQNKNASCSSKCGIVSEITSENIVVNIIDMSACSACHANGLCNAFERKEKIIYVPNIGQQVNSGDEVNVFMKTSMGLKATLIAYILPVSVVVVILLIMSTLGLSESLSGLLSLSSLGIYYYVIYLFREKLKKQISFYIEKK